MWPRCAIDQKSFRFPGARPNMADAWIRNSDWEDDNDLNNDLTEFVSLNLKIMEILDFVRKDYPMYAWSLRSLKPPHQHQALLVKLGCKCKQGDF